MNEIADYLERRRSIAIPALRDPAPDDETLRRMLTIAARVPDHGKLAPWRFVIYRGGAAARIGVTLRELVENREGSLSDMRRDMEEKRFSRSPLVVGVVSTAGPHVKIPEWEQVLSAGAVTMNLVHAAHALGFGANWVTEWVAYDEDAKRILGIAPVEKVVAFVHIGSFDETQADRARPDLDAIVTEAVAPATI